MDQRNREANKRYRTGGGVPCVFESKTIKLDKEVFQETKNRVEQEEDKNMSRFIEDTVGDEIVIHSIRYSVGMENAEVDGVSIYDIAKKSSKLIKRKYDNGIIKDYEELFKIISEVL